MKLLTLFVIFCFLLTSSCANNQSIEEEKILAQFGDSCVNRLYIIIKNTFYPCPPPPPTGILSFFDDTIKAKFKLNRLDTLGYPFKFSVYNFKFKCDSSINEYYKAFAQQNDIRINYIYENIIISDTLQFHNSVLLAKAVHNNDSLINEYTLDSSRCISHADLKNKPKGIAWEIE